ncbi:MAG: hypothetical protein HBSAPP02_23660 [Phycisphaerae bacterium]|nr:MAG: hypothetical protein HBSAPP02_23660 [Phycisphaerae bacterium]
MNSIPTYDGCIEQWKINLALSRIRAFGFSRDQWPDLLQCLALAISKVRFDPTKGAKESTVLYVVINNHLISVRRAQAREDRRVTRHRSCADIRSISQLSPLDLQLDVRLAVAELPPLERSVCVGLMQGSTIRQIASDLGFTWNAVRRLVANVRARFAQLGLDGQVGA